MGKPEFTIESVTEDVRLMRSRLESGQGDATSAMCRLSPRAAEWLLQQSSVNFAAGIREAAKVLRIEADRRDKIALDSAGPVHECADRLESLAAEHPGSDVVGELSELREAQRQFAEAAEANARLEVDVADLRSTIANRDADITTLIKGLDNDATRRIRDDLVQALEQQCADLRATVARLQQEVNMLIEGGFNSSARIATLEAELDEAAAVALLREAFEAEWKWCRMCGDMRSDWDEPTDQPPSTPAAPVEFSAEQVDVVRELMRRDYESQYERGWDGVPNLAEQLAEVAKERRDGGG